METDKAAIEVNAALNAVRRRARYLAQAEGSWSWSEALALALCLGIAAFFIYKGAPEWPGDGAYGMLLFISVLAGWHHRRLSARVDALTKLLSEFEASQDRITAVE